MYDTAAESNTNISFDAVDPFYDALPWFRLIGRYAGSGQLTNVLVEANELYCIVIYFIFITYK